MNTKVVFLYQHCKSRLVASLNFESFLRMDFKSLLVTLESGIDVGQGISVGPGKFVKKNKHRALNKRRA